MPSPRPSRDFKDSPQFIAECRRFGLRVRQLREAAKLTLERASSQAEIDLAHWQKIEAGRVNVTLGTMLRLSNAVGSSLSAFFAEEDRQPARGQRTKRASPRPARSK